MRRFLCSIMLVALLSQSSGWALASGAAGFRLAPTALFSQSIRELMAYELGSGSRRAISRPVAHPEILAPASFSISRGIDSTSHDLAPPSPQNNRVATVTNEPVTRSPKFLRPAAESAAHDDMSKSRLAPFRIREGMSRLVKYPRLVPTKAVSDPLALRMYAKRAASAGASKIISPVVSSRPRGNAGGSRTSASRNQMPPQQISEANEVGEKNRKPLLATTDAGAGMNHYWTYEEHTIPGVGKAMVNVGTGNLLIQTSDFDISERGLDFVMQRTYNSQSLHDANGDDGSEPAIFGNGWTNPYDAHLVLRSNGQISVYDIDGTRCDYTPTSGGTWTPCTGQFATLSVDPNTPCAYWWTKKSGTAYWFYAPYPSGAACSYSPGTIGRVYAIYGRNSYNNVTLSYSFASGQPQTAENITEIDVNHANLQSIVMRFGQVGQTGPNELANITLPDGGKVDYSYDPAGDLAEVDRTDGNDAASVLSETYGTQQPIQSACGPRATLSGQTDGSCMHFDFDGSADLIDWEVKGILNFDPQDGYGKLQAYPTAWQTWFTANFEYGTVSNPPCAESQAGTTTLCDSDGHNTVWTVNGKDQVTQTQVFTGPSTALVTKQSWDPSTFALASSTDARGNETDYGYDSNGNTVYVWQPSQPTWKGTLRPLSLYSYDNFNNIIAYCDPSSNLSATPPPIGDSMCKNQSGKALYGYTYPQYEPFGELTTLSTPCYQGSCPNGGNLISITYDPTQQGGADDYGLPTSVIGRTYAQNDGSQRTPEQQFSYNAVGMLNTYVTGSPEPGQGGQGQWTIAYSQNHMNRVVSRTDPDGYTSQICYQPDGSIYYTETPYQYFLDGKAACTTASPAPGFAHSFNHDADGDVIREYKNHGGTYQGSLNQPTALPSLPPNGVATKKFYDGEDRLVEVIQPQDGNYDIFANAWITRYLYDLSQSDGSATLSFQGGSGTFAAYGGLYKTQEILPSATSDDLSWGGAPNAPSPSPVPTLLNNQVTDITATAYDPVNRAVAKYRIINVKHNEQLATELLKYDSDNAHQGLLSSDCQNSVSECKTFNYDSVAHITQFAFTPSQNTPTRDVTYDPDGRTYSITQEGSSGDTDTYNYDLDGRLLSIARGSESIAYTYYYDGKRSTVNGTLGNNALEYSYAPDGTPQQLNYNFVDKNDSEYYGKMVYGLTAAGRISKRDDYSQTGNPVMESTRSYGYGGLLSEQDYYCQSPCNGQSLPGSHKSLQYTAEGDLLGQFVTAPWYFTPTGTGPTLNQYPETWYYNSRGELAARFDHLGETMFRYANGVLVASYPTKQYYGNGSTFLGAGGEWDARMGASLASEYSYLHNGQGYYTVVTQGSGITYDADGRNISSGYNGSCQASNTTGCGSYAPTDQAESRTYDVENHVLTANASYSGGAFSNQSASAGYVWGADGHPSHITSSANSAYGNDALFWDGDNLLYSATNSGDGAVDDIKIGPDADFLQNDSSNYKGVTFYDRGSDGSVAFCHNTSGGSGGVGDGDASVTQTRFFSGGPSNPCGPASALPTWGMRYPLNVAWNGSFAGFVGNAGVGAGATIGMLRSDGITDGISTVQGARAFDPTAGQWTTPDAYAGIVQDPMTQKSYVWNDNDPVDDEDPSGYTSTVGNAWPGGNNWGWDQHAFVEVREDNMGEVFEYGPQTLNPWSKVLPQPGYGSWLGASNSIGPESHVLPPVKGLSGNALDAAVISVYSGLSTFLENHSACYCTYNSNAVIAAGLLALGYTPAQVNSWIPGPTGVPGSKGTPAEAGQQLLDYIKAQKTAEAQVQNGQVALGLMGSNGMDYCYSCSWSGLLNQ